MSPRYPEMKDNFDHEGFRRGEARELAEATDKLAEQTERELIREIEEEDARVARAGQVDPPPELSPSERRERERDERLARVEQGQDKAEEERRFSREPRSFRHGVESSEQHQRREALRLLRIAKDDKRRAERNREHEKRTRKQTKGIEGRIAELEGQRSAEDDRHAQARAELDGEISGCYRKLEALTRGLGPNETTEDRLRTLEAVA
jgi:hypothetical protein